MHAPAAALPARVLRVIEAQRERSEILTDWVQAAIVALFGTLYLVAPSTSPADFLLAGGAATLGWLALLWFALEEPVNRAAKLQAHTKAERVRALATRRALDTALAQGFAAAQSLHLAPERRIVGVDGSLDLGAIG
jgi:hypothetical protein